MTAIILKRGLEGNRGNLSLSTGEMVYTTDTRRVYIGTPTAPTGAEMTFNELSASFVSASVISSSFISVGTLNASNIVGSMESSSYSDYSVTSSYLSSSGQNVALGDLLSTDTTSNAWAGNQSHTESGIFIQRSGAVARSTLLSAGTVLNGNASYNIAVASGSLSGILPTVQGHFGSWQFQSWGGSTWSTTARMTMQTNSDHSETSRGTDIYFQTIASGSTDLTTKLKVNGTGVQVTGSLSVTGSIGIDDGMKVGRKVVTLNTSSYTTTLTVNMNNNTSVYAKISLHGSWAGSGSAVYVGEYFLQKDDATAFSQPGTIISQINNNVCGEILANIQSPDPANESQNIDIQFWASSSTIPAGNFTMIYEVRGQYNTVI